MSNPSAHVCLVVDRSGSMQSTRADAQGGIDSFVAEFIDSSDVTLTLWEFDDRIEQAVKPVLASAWPGYTLTPRGSTALLDAIGTAAVDTDIYLSAHPAERVVVVIVTDGGENASHEYDKDKVTELIDAGKAKGWEFVFLASDLSAIRTGASVGMATHHFAPASTSSTYSSLTRSVSGYVYGDTATVEWTEETTP